MSLSSSPRPRLDPLYRFLAHRPGTVLALLGVVSLAAVLQLVQVWPPALRLRIETAVEKILPAEGPDRDLYQHFRETFGNDELLFVGLVTDDVFSRDNLARIERMTERFGQVDGIRRVVSLANAPDVRAVEGEVSIRTVYDEVPPDAEDLRALRERVLANPLHVGNLVSADGRTAAFLLYPLEMSEAEFRERGIDETVEAIAHEEAPDAEVLLAGTPPLKAAISRILLRELFEVVPLGYVFIAVVAFAMFRSVRAVAIPLAAIGLAQLWTLAAMVLAGRSLNLVTFIVPPLINAVGFAYSVHVVSEHEEMVREGHAGREAVVEALRRVAFPVLLTGITTIAGLLSLCVSRLPAIREFGVFSVIGVTGSLVAALTLAPAVLALLRTPAGRAGAGEGALERWATRMGTFDVRHRGWLTLAAGTVAVVAAVGVARMQVSTFFTNNLSPDHPLRRSIKAFDRNMQGSITLHTVLETDERDAFKQPERLAAMVDLEDWLEAQPEVGGTTSLAQYLMVVNRAFHDGDPAAFAIPASKSLVSQYLFFFWNDRLESLVSKRFDSADILVRIPAVPSHVTQALIRRMEARLAELPAGIRGHVTGDSPLIVKTMDEISRGQALSLAGATLIIYGVLALYFRSLRVAAWALVPNALPVLVYFGILGWTGVTLNVITSLVACIVLGIAVDDTIHILVRYKETLAEVGDEAKATVQALRSVVRPVTSTTAALCGGFLVFATSALHDMFTFGILATALLAFAWLVDLTITPALASRMGSRRS